MTDEELDRDWKPNGRRPQSTIARSFSQELMDIFRIENSIADLDEQVDKRKQQINTQTSELEAIEARLREMEQRLRSQHPVLNNTGNNSNTMDQRLASAVGTGSPRSPRSPRPPVAGAFDHQSSPEDRRQQQQPRDAQEANGEDVPPPPPAKDYVARRAAAEAKSRSAGRGGVARPSQQAVPGALPPTPVASEGEYELVHRLPNHSVVPAPAAAAASSPRALPPALPVRSPAHAPSSPPLPLSRSQDGVPADVFDSDSSESVDLADFVMVSTAKDGDGEQDA